jgi:hypothetical protein
MCDHKIVDDSRKLRATDCPIVQNNDLNIFRSGRKLFLIKDQPPSVSGKLLVAKVIQDRIKKIGVTL